MMCDGGDLRVCDGIFGGSGEEQGFRIGYDHISPTRILALPFMIQSIRSKSIPKKIAYQNFHNNSSISKSTTWLYIAYNTCTIRAIINLPK